MEFFLSGDHMVQYGYPRYSNGAINDDNHRNLGPEDKTREQHAVQMGYRKKTNLKAYEGQKG